MDYVGCKGSTIRNTASSIWRFYMDYVGCKVDYGCHPEGENQCFIWTMWDVKVDFWERVELTDGVLYGLCGM